METKYIFLLTLIILFAYIYLRGLFQEWNYKIKKRRGAENSIPRIPVNYFNQYNMKTKIDKPEIVGIMNHLLEDARAIRLQLKEKENNARELKRWLNENPNAGEEAVIKAKQQLLDALQSINDLVCKLKPRHQYIIK